MSTEYERFIPAWKRAASTTSSLSATAAALEAAQAAHDAAKADFLAKYARHQVGMVIPATRTTWGRHQGVRKFDAPMRVQRVSVSIRENGQVLIRYTGRDAKTDTFGITVLETHDEATGAFISGDSFTEQGS